MFEQRTNSINGSFRHQQSELLSHALEPGEFPIPKSRTRCATGSGKTHSPQPTCPETRVNRSGTCPSSPTSSSWSSAKPVRNHEPALFLEAALKTPLLTREQEQHLFQQIFRYRQAFQRLILKEPAVVQYVVGLLSQWESNHLRIDAICNLGLSELEKRNKLEPKIRLSLKALKRMPKRIRSASSARESRRLHRKTICLVEDLWIRPQRFESAPFENAMASELLAEYRLLCQYVTQANLRLVVRVARQICGSSPALPDMIQEGNRGLIHAISKFDHQCNVRFSTYATPWIKQAIFGALPNSQRNIRVPENFRAVSRKVQRGVRDLRNTSFELREPDSGQIIALIAKEVKMKPADVERHLCVARDTCSLDQSVGGYAIGAESTSNLVDVLPDHRQISPLDLAHVRERDEFVRSIMSQALTRREHDVISLRFGMEDGEDRSLAEVGRVMGLTRQRVCQVEKQALEKLGKVTHRMDFSFDSCF